MPRLARPTNLDTFRRQLAAPPATAPRPGSAHSGPPGCLAVSHAALTACSRGSVNSTSAGNSLRTRTASSKLSRSQDSEAHHLNDIFFIFILFFFFPSKQQSFMSKTIRCHDDMLLFVGQYVRVSSDFVYLCRHRESVIAFIEPGYAAGKGYRIRRRLAGSTEPSLHCFFPPPSFFKHTHPSFGSCSSLFHVHFELLTDVEVLALPALSSNAWEK